MNRDYNTIILKSGKTMEVPWDAILCMFSKSYGSENYRSVTLGTSLFHVFGDDNNITCVINNDEIAGVN